MFWDGTRWIDERSRPAPRAPRPGQRIVDILATGVIVVVLGAAAIPFSQAAAGTPTVQLSPSDGPVGTVVNVRAQNLRSRINVRLTWDGVAIVEATTTRNGNLTAVVTVPDATIGAHAIGVAAEAKGARGAKAAAAETVVAVATFTLDADSAGSSPAPATAPPTVAPSDPVRVSPTPTAGPTLRPTLVPTQAPSNPTPAPPDPTPAPPDPTAPPPPPNALTGMYGSAFAMDDKNNYQVGWRDNEVVSHRFRAGTSSTLNSVAFIQRGGVGYSGGNGGRMEISVQTDSGGVPSGKVLASLTFSPGNPSGNWENKQPLTFPDPAQLTKGVVYHIVFRNPDPSGATNYVSVNEVYQYLALADRQPFFSNDFAVLNNQGSGWNVLPHDTPAMDLKYGNGFHDGNAYTSLVANYYSEISGVQMAREKFTVNGSTRVVTSAAVRVKRVSGTSPLVIRLEASNGTVLASGTASGTQIPLSPLPVQVNGSWDASLPGSRWVTVDFGEPITLMSGSTYRLRLSTSDDTLYAALPLREQTDPVWGSRAFHDGVAERTSGTNWALVYPYGELDLQFYLK